MTDLGGLKGLLFDKDGTLIDFFATWMPAYCLAADRIAAAAGVPGHADRLLLAGGYDRANDRLAPDSLLAAGTNEELIALWRASLEGRATADLDRIVLETFAEYSAGDITPTADLPALFADLHASGYLLGIATNDDTEAACYAAEHLGLTAMLALVVGADAGHGGKPGPGMALAFCAASGLHPSQVAIIGDSAADSGMARAAGLGAAIGVCTGAAPAAALAPHFDVVIDSVADLPTLLAGRCLTG
ncbi:MAG: HAD family hydrolase [Proteobacteria bacterium]|nr:HAD family hydrolase [Pseudomonadota bacterium]MDA1070204.1 HAD family hydrolase [Pseudomonadota bacterium]